MVKILLFAVLLFITNNCLFSQTIDEFKEDFKKTLNKDFSEEELNKLFQKYSIFLTPHNGSTQLMNQLKGNTLYQYPLLEFKEDLLYIQNIKNLINSDNSNQRILAYLIIASTGDTSFEDILLKKIKSESKEGNLVWSGMALMYLGTKYTTELFDFLVDNEDFGDAHMIPLYFKLNLDSLQSTAYQRINSDNVKAKILAAQILSQTGLNPKTEELLKKSVIEWDIDIKGYAIYSLKELQIGNLYNILGPLLDSSQIREIALEALANSPTKEDLQFLYNQVENYDTIPEEFLNCFFNSKNIENVKFWLKLISTKNIPEEYTFFVFKQPLLTSKAIMEDLYNALEKIHNPNILSELLRVLSGKLDSKSINILISYLNNENSDVRYWVAETLKNKTSKIPSQLLIDLISNQDLRTNALVDLIIEKELDTLQFIFESILDNEKDLDWKRSSVKYLSIYPTAKHKVLFRRLLQDKDEDTFVKRDAALGLGRLKDVASTELIIDVCKSESENSDYNSQEFLIALSKLKSEEAKKYIESYKNSDEEVVRSLVKQLLNEW